MPCGSASTGQAYSFFLKLTLLMQLDSRAVGPNRHYCHLGTMHTVRQRAAARGRCPENYGYRQCCSKAKAACTMQHAARGTQQDARLSGRKPVSPGRKSTPVTSVLNPALAVQYSSGQCRAGMRRYVSQAWQGLTGRFWRELQPWRPCTFSRHAREEANWAFDGGGGVQDARFVLFYAAHSGLWRRVTD